MIGAALARCGPAGSAVIARDRRARWLRRIAVALFVLGLWCVPATVSAQNCSISTTPVAFGSYDVLAAAPVDSTGTVRYQCILALPLTITLSRGSSTTFTPRTMNNGSEVLTYNLYLNAARTNVWGDGTGGTQTYTALAAILVPVTVTVYGRIPAGQNVAAGSYTDTVVATLIF